MEMVGGMVIKHQHPTAIVESEGIGDGTRIWHFVHIREGAKIGRGCNIGKSVYIDVDVAMGNNVKVQNFVSIYKELKGFVCYCGNKLKTVVEEREEGVVYGCSCGETVEIKKELLAWTM